LPFPNHPAPCIFLLHQTSVPSSVVPLPLCFPLPSLQPQTLPLFIDRLADPFTAVILSVSVVLTFGKLAKCAVIVRLCLAS
jgi:hypothetical protein